MRIADVFYNGVSNFAYLLRSGHSISSKTKIFFTWLKINFKMLLWARFVNLRHETVLGYKIEAFDYETIRLLFEEIFFRNEYLFSSTHGSPTILDCGANIGLATLFFKWLYPNSIIYAFEPEPRTFEILKHNVAQNALRDVRLFNCALAGWNGKVDFFAHPDNPATSAMSTVRERAPGNRTQVDCISLSSFLRQERIQRVDFMKMDIEGSEMEVIQDLDEQHQLHNIAKCTIEYHHNIPAHTSRLGAFLGILEKSNFNYQLSARCNPMNAEHKFQDILLYAYQ